MTLKIDSITVITVGLSSSDYMVELTIREKKIVILQNDMSNPEMKDVPFDVQQATTKAMWLVMDFIWNDDEVTDLLLAINEVHKQTHESAMGKLDKYKHLLTSHFKL